MLELNFIAGIFAILLIIIITTVIYLILENKYNISNLEVLFLIVFTSIMGLCTLNGWYTTSEFYVNYSELSYVHIFILWIGISFNIISVIDNKKEDNYLSYIKNILKKVRDTFKKDPFIALMVSIFFLFFLLSLQLVCNFVGLTISYDSWFIYIVCLYTRMILLKLIIVMILLPFTKNIKKNKKKGYVA